MTSTYIAILALTAANSTDVKDIENKWKETSVVPIGTSFIAPAILTRSLGDTTKINISAPLVNNQAKKDFISFLGTGVATVKLEPYIMETSDVRYLDANLAATMGYLSASASAGGTTIVMVEQWRKFIPVTIPIDNLGTKVVSFDKKGRSSPKNRDKRESISAWVGFSMSIVTRLEATNARASLGSVIKSFTAGVDFQKFSASCHTEVIGLSDRRITSSLPSSIDFVRVQSDSTSETDQKQAAPSRYRALVEQMALRFQGMRNTAWDAGYVQPMVIGLDLDAIERMSGRTYDFYTPNKGGQN